MAPLCMAENWPRFRGANGQGISNQSAPIEWNQNKNIKWRSELPGPGSSSPVIFGNKIFVTCFSGVSTGDQDTSKLVRYVLCLDKDRKSVV